jgi:hypothetical protein
MPGDDQAADHLSPKEISTMSGNKMVKLSQNGVAKQLG